VTKSGREKWRRIWALHS